MKLAIDDVLVVLNRLLSVIRLICYVGCAVVSILMLPFFVAAGTPHFMAGILSGILCLLLKAIVDKLTKP